MLPGWVSGKAGLYDKGSFYGVYQARTPFKKATMKQKNFKVTFVPDRNGEPRAGGAKAGLGGGGSEMIKDRPLKDAARRPCPPASLSNSPWLVSSCRRQATKHTVGRGTQRRLSQPAQAGASTPSTRSATPVTGLCFLVGLPYTGNAC